MKHHPHRHPPWVYLRGYVYDFIELFALHPTRKVVEAAMREEQGSDYPL